MLPVRYKHILVCLPISAEQRARIETVQGFAYRFTPRTVRESAIRAVMQIRSWRHRAASNRAVVQEKDGQFSVVCSIADMGSDVFRMELAMPDKLTAEMIKNNFIAHGSDIFPKLCLPKIYFI